MCRERKSWARNIISWIQHVYKITLSEASHYRLIAYKMLIKDFTK